MNRAVAIILMLLATVSLAACRAGAPRVPGASTTVAVPGSSTTLAALGSSTSPAQPSAEAPVILTAGPLSVSITSPANEAVVNTAQVVVSGQAPPETVVTINDTIVVVDASGQFSATVGLEAGPNELALKASDPDGNQANSQLIVTYEPTN